MQSYSQSTQLCSSGETRLDAAIQQLAIPNFSVERFKYHYQQASKVNWIATLQAGPPFTPIMLSDVPLAPSAKQKRNQKTREQYKKRGVLQATIQLQTQEVEQSMQISVEKLATKHTRVRVLDKKASKHVVLKHMAIWMATSVHAAVIHLNDFMDLIMVDHWTNGMRRMGVG